MTNWELDEGTFLAGDCSKTNELSNTGFLARRNHIKKSQEIHMYGRLHADICNVPKLIVNGVKMQIELTKPSPRSTCWVTKSVVKYILKFYKHYYTFNESGRVLVLLMHIMKLYSRAILYDTT